MNYEFVEVLPSHEQVEILFKLLSQRKYNISHNKMPNLEEHKNFVFSNPYKNWFLVKSSENYIGTFYLQENNSISINIEEIHYKEYIPLIFEFIKLNFKPNKQIKSLRPKNFYINVPINDLKFQKVLENNGYKPLQISYSI